MHARIRATMYNQVTTSTSIHFKRPRQSILASIRVPDGLILVSLCLQRLIMWSGLGCRPAACINNNNNNNIDNNDNNNNTNYIYIHMYTSIYIYIVLYIYIYYVYISLSISIYLSIYLSLSLSIYIYIYIHMANARTRDSDRSSPRGGHLEADRARRSGHPERYII